MRDFIYSWWIKFIELCGISFSCFIGTGKLGDCNNDHRFGISPRVMEDEEVGAGSLFSQFCSWDSDLLYFSTK